MNRCRVVYLNLLKTNYGFGEREDEKDNYQRINHNLLKTETKQYLNSGYKAQPAKKKKFKKRNYKHLKQHSDIV